MGDVHEKSISITEAIDQTDRALLIFRHFHLGFCRGEIHRVQYWYPDEDLEGYMDVAGKSFFTSQDAQEWYATNYSEVYAFSREQDWGDAWQMIEDDMRYDGGFR
jgi:hypothetical protein